MYKKINLEEVKQKLADMPADGSLRKALDKVPFLKMEQGQNTIRILPALSTSNTSLPYVERLQHGPYKHTGKFKFYTCGKAAGTECPLCQAGEKPKDQYLMNVINRKDGETYVWQTGPQKIKTINVLLLNAPDMFDPEQGFDVIVDAQGPSDKNRRYNGPNLIPRMKPAGAKHTGYDLEAIVKAGYDESEMKDLASYLSSMKDNKDESEPF